MIVRDEVLAAAERIGLPPLELRSELAQNCADARIPEELILAHTDLVEYLLTGIRASAQLPRGGTQSMLPTPPPDGGFYAAPGYLLLSLQGIEALALAAGIRLRPGKIATVCARAKTMTHGLPHELLDRLYELLAHLAYAADHPDSGEHPI